MGELYSSGVGDSRAPASLPIIPDYEVLRLIGRGAYGEVWLARSTTGLYRAVKVVRRSSFDHDRPFEREFDGIQKFEPISYSESQVHILHVGRNDAAGYFYYVMELADDAAERSNGAMESGSDGTRQQHSITSSLQHSITPLGYVPKTLKHELHARGRLPFEECVQIGLALTNALAHLHKSGLVHRDVKPSNIIFVNGVPKLADIGLVTSVDATRSFVGTEGYLAPTDPGTPQADLYSLGKVLYEISTGLSRREFPALPDDIATVADRQQLSELNAVIVKACQVDPSDRYQSAEQMRADLELLQRGRSIKRKRIIGRRLVLGAKVLSTLAVIGSIPIGGYFLRDGNSSTNQHKRVEDPEVTSLCKLARFQYYTRTEEGNVKALEYFNRALEIDPKCVRAYAGIADLCTYIDNEFLPPKKAEAKMRWARDKLMAINSRLAEGHAVQGFIHLVYDWTPGEAERELNLAVELDLELLIGHIWRGKCLLFTGKFDDAEEEFKRARQLDPERYGVNAYIGLPSFFARRYDQAIEHFENVTKRLSSWGWAGLLIGRANEEGGDYRAAIDALQKAELLESRTPEAVKQKYAELREAYEKSGQDGYWQKKLAFAQRGYGAWHAWTDALVIAQLYAHLGDADKAFEWLDKAFQEKSEDHLWLNVDPGWDRIRSDPRFVALLEKMGFRLETARTRQLSPAEIAGTRSLEAYKKYEQGRTARRQGNAEGLKEALKLMREAVELDPSFFWAWEELFSIYMESEGADAKSQLRVIAKKLEQLNANSAEAHAAQAWIAYEDFEFGRADHEFQRAIGLDPSRPRPHRRYGQFLLQCGRLQEARKEFGECETLEPGFARTQTWLGDCFFVERKYAQALAQYEHSLRLAQLERVTYTALAQLYEADHQILKAIDAFQKTRALNAEEPERISQRYDALRQAFREEGERGYWSKRLEQAEAESNLEKEPYLFAVFHARLGHKDQALALLENAWAVKDTGLRSIIVDQHWDDLRNNERFKKLLREIGYATDWPVR